MNCPSCGSDLSPHHSSLIGESSQRWNTANENSAGGTCFHLNEAENKIASMKEELYQAQATEQAQDT